MKGTKKLLSILMVLTLVLSLSAGALAATVTIEDADTTSTYTAYQLLNATYDEGTGLYQYTLNTTYAKAIEAGLKAVSIEDITEVTTANQNKVVEAISNLTPDQARQFADAAYKAIQADDTMKNAGVKADGKTFKNMEGYYLIAETVGEGNNTATSLVMLGTYGPEEKKVTTKEDRPSSEKKVKETNDTAGSTSDWQDAADYDIGDAVPFQLKATIPANTTKGYSTYQVVFHDTLGTGLTFTQEDADIKVFLGGQEIDSEKYTVTSTTADNCTFEITINDIKTLEGFQEGQENVITVEYKATLNDRAVIGGDGNPNTMHITYSNNPYGEGSGRTPDDKVVVFTFELDVDKVDGAGDALGGAAFTLLKKIENKETPEGTKALNELASEELKENTYVTVDGTLYQIVGAPVSANDEITKFTFKGQDSGSYLLVETTVPTGFNKAENLAFTVTATYDKDNNDPKLTGLTVDPAEKLTADQGTGIISTTVTNLTGVELPETGGIGTTIFYVAGAVLVAAAAVLLVTKKRVNGAEK